MSVYLCVSRVWTPNDFTPPPKGPGGAPGDLSPVFHTSIVITKKEQSALLHDKISRRGWGLRLPLVCASQFQWRCERTIFRIASWPLD